MSNAQGNTDDQDPPKIDLQETLKHIAPASQNEELERLKDLLRHLNVPNELIRACIAEVKVCIASEKKLLLDRLLRKSSTYDAWSRAEGVYPEDAVPVKVIEFERDML